MSFSFLAPLSLFLGALSVLVVLAHLARQTPRDRQAFGAMLLIGRLVKRLRSQRRVRDLLLLVLRILAFVLITLAMSQPIFRWPGGSADHGGTGKVVFVVDRSLSMSQIVSGQTLLESNRTLIKSTLADIPAGTELALIQYDDQAVRLTPDWTTDPQAILSRLEAISPSYGASNLKSALHEARRMLKGEPGEVLLFSDEAGTQVSNAASELAALVARSAVVESLGKLPDSPNNVTVSKAEYGSGPQGGVVTVRLANYSEVGQEVSCDVILPDGATIPIFVDTPPLGEAEERVTLPVEAEGGIGEVRCPDSNMPLDDSRFFHLPRVGASRVLVVDGDPGDTPTKSEVYFLERALSPYGGRRGDLTVDITSPAGLASLNLDTHRVVFLANVADPRPFAPMLLQFVRSGGNIIISGGDSIVKDRYNSSLASLLPAPIRRVRSVAAVGETGISLQLPNVKEPLFAPFRRAGRSSFSDIKAHTLLTFAPYSESEETRTLLRYEGDLPALVERNVGRGKVWIWTSTFDLGWGNLPLQAAFMPMVQQMVAVLGGAADASARFDGEVGHQLSIPLPDLQMAPHIIGPDGKELHSSREGTSILFTPKKPGVYKLQLQSSVLAWISVNTSPEESDVQRKQGVEDSERQLDSKLLTQSASMSQPLLLGGLVLFALTALISTRSKK